MTTSHNGNGNHGGSLAVEMTPQPVTEELLGRVYNMSRGFKLAVGVLLLVFIGGVIGFVIRASDGFDDRAPWGYYTATFAFVFTVCASAPLVAIALRITKNHFRRPLSRASEMFALVGLLIMGMFIPLMFIFPSMDGASEEVPVRKSIWFEVPFHENLPIWADAFAIGALLLCGLVILHVSGLPDMAAAGRRGGRWRRRLYGPLVNKWTGSEHQWNLHKGSLALLGAFYFMMLMFVHFLIASDFALALVPGWIDSIMPAHHALTGLQAGLGIVLLTCFLLRTVGGYREYIGLDLFWSAGKILLGLSLLWGYFWFAEFNTFWYGRKPVEEEIIRLTMVDTYSLAFYLNMIGSFLIPFALLIWNPIRKSIIGPTIAAASVVIGAFFMMVRFYVPAMGVEDIIAHDIVEINGGANPGQLDTIWPGGPDLLIIFGAIAGVGLIFLLGTRLLPVMSLWEIKEGLLYRVIRPLVRGRYVALGKPE